MNYFEKNLKAIKKNQKLIKTEHLIDYATSENFKVSVCRDGNKTIKYVGNGKSIYFHSPYYPIKESKQHINQILETHQEQSLIFGLGFGYYLSSFILKNNLNNYKIIVFEPSYEIFNEFIRNVDCEALLLNEDVTIIIEDLSVLKSHFEHAKNFLNSSDLGIFVLPVYSKIFNETYKKFLNEAEIMIYRQKITNNTLESLSHIWSEAFVNNLNYILDGYNAFYLKDKFKNIPAIIVSSGPSLNKNIHLLKNIKGKALILCPYTSYKPLKALGIEPDFLISIDSRQTIHETNSENDQNFTEPLFTSIIGSSALLKKHDGINIFSLTKSDIFFTNITKNLDIEILICESGGSVSTNGIDILYHLGCEPIVFVGQDFAFKDNKTHVSGTYYEDFEKKSGINSIDIFKNRLIEVEGNYEDKVTTDYTYNTYRIWTEEYIELKKDRTYINATEGGAKIKGTIILSLKETIEKYLHNDYSKDINTIINKFIIEGKLFNEKNLVLIKNKLKKVENSLNEVSTLLSENISESEKLIKNYTFSSSYKESTVQNIISKLKENDAKIKHYSNDLEIVNYIFQATAAHLTKIKEENPNDSEELITAKQSNFMYKGLFENIDEFLVLFKEKLKTL